MDVNEIKLGNVVKSLALRPAHSEEIAASGAVAGYASPIGLRDVLVVADDSVTTSPNLVAGANEAGYHFKNVNYGRDYEADVVADIATVEEGDGCAKCGQPLATSRGVEVGHIFQLGTRYSDSMGCTFLDPEGKARSVIMGSYGIGVGRLMACVAEEHRDENGLMWPVSVAPFQVHIVALAKGEGAAQAASEKLYGDLKEVGIEVLYDDRLENPGVKFKDADLIGCPIRITVGERSLKKGELELKLRGDGEATGVPVEDIVSHVQQRLASLRAELDGAVTDEAVAAN
jgi:prolyl-tRNA synthetase